MNLNERLLVKSKASKELFEFRVIEYDTSKQNIKLQSSDGTTEWFNVQKFHQLYETVEILPSRTANMLCD